MCVKLATKTTTRPKKKKKIKKGMADDDSVFVCERVTENKVIFREYSKTDKDKDSRRKTAMRMKPKTAFYITTSKKKKRNETSTNEWTRRLLFFLVFLLAGGVRVPFRMACLLGLSSLIDLVYIQRRELDMYRALC